MKFNKLLHLLANSFKNSQKKKQKKKKILKFKKVTFISPQDGGNIESGAGTGADKDPVAPLLRI